MFEHRHSTDKYRLRSRYRKIDTSIWLQNTMQNPTSHSQAAHTAHRIGTGSGQAFINHHGSIHGFGSKVPNIQRVGPLWPPHGHWIDRLLQPTMWGRAEAPACKLGLADIATPKKPCPPPLPSSSSAEPATYRHNKCRHSDQCHRSGDDIIQRYSGQVRAIPPRTIDFHASRGYSIAIAQQFGSVRQLNTGHECLHSALEVID